MKRCDWLTDNDIYIKYHDEEWGVPAHDDRKLFEMLNLGGAQLVINSSSQEEGQSHYYPALSYLIFNHYHISITMYTACNGELIL